MNEQMENLAKLQAVELERGQLLKTAQALPAEIAEVERSLAAEKKRETDTEAALKREDELRSKLEREAAQHRQKATRYRAQLDTVTTPAQAAAIEHEVQFSDSEVERIEGEEFASLERTETQEATLAAARAEIADWTAGLEKTKQRVAARKVEIAADVATLDAERARLRQAADPELLARYDRIAASRGTGLSRADNQQCSGCQMGVRPQVWNELREGQIRTCDSCGRLLYWNPAIAATPKAPVPETPTTNGDGRAIRKPPPAEA